MYKTISNEIIRRFDPCYDPLEIITNENEELPIKEWLEKYRSIVPTNDILWLLLRREFMSEKDLRLFSVWCARDALKLIEKPDHISIEACDVAERYANGEATEEELLAARNAAAYVAYVATDNAAANYAASAAYYTTRATYYAARIAYYAARASYYAARAASHYDSSATYEALYNVMRSMQLDKLLTYFK
jgi:hypothetical protein